MLFEEKDAMFLGLMKKTNKNEKITALMELTKKIVKLDSIEMRSRLQKL